METKLSKDQLSKLKDIFYSDEFGMRNAQELYKEANKRGMNLSFKQVKKGFYDNQEIVQMFAPQKKQFRSANPIKSRYTGERVYFDVAFFPDQKLATINAVDLHSKYAWVKPIRIKRRLDATKNSVDSKKASVFLVEVLEDVEKRGFSVDSATFDAGKEFEGLFRKLLDEENIPFTVTPVGDHLALAPIDSFTRSLRISAEKWLNSKGGDLYKQIPKIVEAYNNRPRRTGLSPKELFSIGVSKTETKKSGKEDRPFEFKVGDTVRINVRGLKNPFNKIKPNWSKELYTVKKVLPAIGRLDLSNGKRYLEKDVIKIPFPDRIERYG